MNNSEKKMLLDGLLKDGFLDPKPRQFCNGDKQSRYGYIR